VKTGRLLKLQRRGTDIHVYLYQDAAVFKAAIYVRSAGAVDASAPAHEISGTSGRLVEEAARAWVDARYPR
jgi:hypothetical protein